jgi:hypothetical protein
MITGQKNGTWPVICDLQQSLYDAALIRSMVDVVIKEYQSTISIIYLCKETFRLDAVSMNISNEGNSLPRYNSKSLSAW